MPEAPLKILINCPLSESHIARLRALSPRVELVFVDNQERQTLTDKEVSDVDVIYATAMDFNPAAAKRLRWAQTDTAAVNHVMGKPIWRSDVPLANVSGAYSVAVAECAIAMLLAISRKLPLACKQQAEHNWDDVAMQGIDLHGKTMGIIGYGSIGRQIARIADAMGMRILACKRNPERRAASGYLLPGTGDPEGVIPIVWYGIEQVAEMLPQCDIMMVTLPLTEQTHHIVGRQAFAALPRHAWVLNMGRGPVIDEAALVEALQNGTIAAAALDVFEEEPLPKDNPLWDMPNVFIMPHVASWSTAQAERAGEVLIENLRRDLNGEPLMNVIDKQFMY